MAAPGTVTHVLEVARQLADATAAHAASIQQVASAAVPLTQPGAEAVLPPDGH